MFKIMMHLGLYIKSLMLFYLNLAVLLRRRKKNGTRD